ncbi:histidine kinase N-terminal 7TM domain-containing diguanylate cyclase [Planobispora rosea]|uniref:histidine kinase N-terminal 7TM domain-containing diguanylate cyclase n=1 Tax=Planobispora rosea TaxID=35762 RepID=UPI00083A5102|nr:diguanylate cyclase [Planobispora rosea]
MDVEPLALLPLFGLSTVIAFTVGVIAWRRRHVAPLLGSLAVVSMAIAEWSLISGILTQVEVGMTRHILATLAFVGVCLVPAGFFVVSQAMVNRAWRLPRRTALLLAIEPMFVIVGGATNPWHHLFFLPGTGTRMAEGGPLIWVHIAYTYVLLMVAMVRVFSAWAWGPRSQRRLYGFTLLGAVPPFLGNLLNVMKVVQGVDLAPVGFCVSVVVIYFLLVRFPMYELVPVARQNVLDMIDDMIVTVDASGRILDLNPAADHLVRGLMPEPPARLTGLPLNDVLCDVTLSEGTEADRIYANYKDSGVDLNVRISSLRDDRDGHVGWAVVARDITALNEQRRELEQANVQLHGQRRELEQANARLHEQLRTIELLRADLAEQAVRDALTGLHNRRHLMEELARLAAECALQGRPLSVALLDVDHFKQVNDRYGHGAGDEVLVRVAGWLREAAGAVAGAVAARYGGEEFVLVLPGLDAVAAGARVEVLRARVAAEPVRAGGRPVPVTFSAGVACRTAGQSLEAGQTLGAGQGLEIGQGLEELLHAADEALYAAKRAGRNRVELAGGLSSPGVAA